MKIRFVTLLLKECRLSEIFKKIHYPLSFLAELAKTKNELKSCTFKLQLLIK